MEHLGTEWAHLPSPGRLQSENLLLELQLPKLHLQEVQGLGHGDVLA